MLARGFSAWPIASISKDITKDDAYRGTPILRQANAADIRDTAHAARVRPTRSRCATRLSRNATRVDQTARLHASCPQISSTRRYRMHLEQSHSLPESIPTP